MEFVKRIILLVVKIAVVLLIPYYWLVDSTRTSTISAVTGIWGISQGGGSYGWNPALTPIWAENQLLFSLLFILPLITFSLFYGERALDRKCVAAAGLSVFISCIVTFLSSPSALFGFYFLGPTLVVPNVVSLAMFVFVFWPLLKNSWPSFHDTEVFQEEPRLLSKVRRVLGKYVPISIATLVWVSIVIFPEVLSISNYVVSEIQLSYNIGISGGLSSVSYYYTWFTSSGSYYPSYLAALTFSIIAGISPGGLIFWSLNLWLGVTTLRFIVGKSTKKRVRMLALAIILIYAISALMVTVPTLLMNLGYYIIPLPFYPLIMLLVARFVQAPTQKQQVTGDIIQVPLRTRISSLFERKRSKEDSPLDTDKLSEEDSDIFDT